MTRQSKQSSNTMEKLEMIKSYRELIKIPNFIDRYEYLKIGCNIGEETFGFDRYINQILYRSSEWKRTRRNVIVRDNGNDLGIEGRPIGEHIIIHHINPLTKEMIEDRDPSIFDMNNLISCSLRTYNAIHYVDDRILFKGITERFKGDTYTWR